jgi:hypothetical protein
MKSLRQIFMLTRRDQRVVVVMMVILIVVTFAERYRRAHPQIAPSTSRSVTKASSNIVEEPVTTDAEPRNAPGR